MYGKETMTISIWQHLHYRKSSGWSYRQRGVVWEQRLHQVNYAYANSLQCYRQWFLKWFQYENWATALQTQQNDLCAQRRLISAWASAQSDQSQRCPPEANLGPKLPSERTARTLNRLGGCPGWSETLIRLGGCPGWSESSLGTKVILLVLSWGGSKCFFLESTCAAHIHFITFFTFCIEPNMKSFSHANNIVLRRDIYIHSLNWC